MGTIQVNVMGIDVSLYKKGDKIRIDTNYVGFKDQEYYSTTHAICQFVLSEIESNCYFDDSDKPYTIESIIRNEEDVLGDISYTAVLSYNDYSVEVTADVLFQAVEQAIIQLIDHETKEKGYDTLFDRERYVYRMTTNTFWFDFSDGAVMARNEAEAKEYAKNILRAELENVNTALKKINVEMYYYLENVEVERSDL